MIEWVEALLVMIHHPIVRDTLLVVMRDYITPLCQTWEVGLLRTVTQAPCKVSIPEAVLQVSIIVCYQHAGFCCEISVWGSIKYFLVEARFRWLNTVLKDTDVECWSGR